MKKTAIILSLLTTLNFAMPLHAENTGIAARSSAKEASSPKMAWGIALGAVAVLATMSGIIAASATSSSHVH